MGRGCDCSTTREPGWRNAMGFLRRLIVCSGAAVCVVVLIGIVGCAQKNQSSEDPVTVMAASSLVDVLPPIVQRTEREQGVQIRLVFAASSTLARQIEAGVPADVFFSADERWLDYLAQRGLVDADATAVPIGNRLVLIAPADAASIASAVEVSVERAIAGVPPSTRIVIGDPAHVPAGRYARAALQALGLWETLSGRLAYADNARAALALVARGEAALGVVYATDVALSDDVRVVSAIPSAPAHPVRYAVGLTNRNASGRTRAVFDALIDDASRRAFGAAGFELL